MPEENTTTETVETKPETVTTETVTTEVTEGETAEQKAERLAKELAGAQSRIGELNKENEKRRLAEKKAAEDKLAEEGKLQELAETREKERDAVTAERDTMAQKLARYDEILSADIEKRIKDWPEEVKKLVPSGEGVDSLVRMERISEIEPLAKKLMDAPAKAGNGAGPNPSGGAAMTIDEIKKRKLSTSTYPQL